MHRFRSLYRSGFGGLVLGLTLGVPPVTATEVMDLYRVQVVVDLEAENPRQEGFQRAMAELLVRLTGRRDAATNPLLVDLVETASRFVQRWGIENEELLAVTFDGRALEDELARREQPVWGADRPLTVVWLALDVGAGQGRLLRELEEVSPDDPAAELAGTIITDVTAAAERRGVPLVFPLIDFEDLSLVTFADVWGGFTSSIQSASQRYQPDGILVGRVRAVGGVVTVRWRYLGADEQRERRTSVAEGVEWLADIYANQYAVTGSASLARLVVTEVSNFRDYARVMEHLEGLSIIDSVTVEELRGDQLILALDTRGKAEILERALSRGGIIKPIAAPLPDPTALDLNPLTARYFQVLR